MNETLMGILPLIILFLLLWVMVFLPNSKREKQRQAMLNALKAGDRVETIGRIFGTVDSIRKDKVILKIGIDNYGSNELPKICVHRDAIARVLSEEESKIFFE